MVNIRQLSDHIFLEIGIINKKKCKKGTPRRFWFCILNPSSIEKFCTGNVHGNLPLKVRKKCIHYEKEREGKNREEGEHYFLSIFLCDERKNLNAMWYLDMVHLELKSYKNVQFLWNLCYVLKFFLWMKWAPKRDLQSEEKFLDVDCLGFGNICF